MFPNLPLPRIFPTAFCDASDAVGTTASTLKETVKSAVTLKETELTKWRRIFDAHAKTEVDGQKCVLPPPDSPAPSTALLTLNLAFPPVVFANIRFLNPEHFVNAIAPSSDVKIARGQWSMLFRVADKNRRGLVSWDDFMVFETALKRPDADYWVAFQYFDVCVTFASNLRNQTNYFVTVTTAELSLLTSSRMSSTRMLDLMPFRSTLTGKCPLPRV